MPSANQGAEGRENTESKNTVQVLQLCSRQGTPFGQVACTSKGHLYRQFTICILTHFYRQFRVSSLSKMQVFGLLNIRVPRANTCSYGKNNLHKEMPRGKPETFLLGGNCANYYRAIPVPLSLKLESLTTDLGNVSLLA